MRLARSRGGTALQLRSLVLVTAAFAIVLVAGSSVSAQKTPDAPDRTKGRVLPDRAIQQKLANPISIDVASRMRGMW